MYHDLAFARSGKSKGYRIKTETQISHSLFQNIIQGVDLDL